MASAGCSCSEESGPATMPCAPISASGVSPSRSAASWLATTSAAAPSEIGLAEPAVIVPSRPKAGRSRRQRLGGDALADPLVDRDHQVVTATLRDLDLDDLLGHHAAAVAAARPLVRPGGEGVLVRPADLPLAGVARHRSARPSPDR